MLFFTILILSGLCQLAASLQIPMPAEADKGEFIGCYLDLPVAKEKPIVGSMTSSDCIEMCISNFYRYALVKIEKQCACSNFLGDKKNSSMCAAFCLNCDMKDQLSDVFNTAIRMNGPPSNFLIVNITDTQALLTWDKPESYISIEKYKITAHPLSTYSHSPLSTFLRTNEFSNDTFKATIVALQPGTAYNFTIQADSLNIEGAKVYKRMKTLIGVPDSSPKAPQILKKHDSTMTIRMEPVSNNNGPVTSYLIVVIEANVVQAVQTDNLKSYSQANSDGNSYYVTAEIQPYKIDEPFVIGDGKVYGKYFNAPLQDDKNYHVMIGMLSKENGREFVVYSDTAALQLDVIMSHMPSNDAEESSTVIVLLSLAIVIISLLLVMGLIAFYFLRNRVILNHRQRLNDNQELTIQGPMIDVENNGYIPDDELPQTSNHRKSLHERVWVIPRDTLTIDQSEFLGYGKFGRMHPGSVLKNDQLKSAIVYCISDKKLQHTDKRSMLKDLDMVIKTSGNPHVLDLIGTCDRSDMVAIVLEQPTQTLKDFLLNSRIQNGNNFTTMTEPMAINFAWGIARGMEHLHNSKIVHRQLCSMHIQIANQQPKIAGFGLTKFYKSETYPNLLRHTAREILQGQEANIKSDVWAYAIVLWEICTLGGTPFGTTSNEELRDRIIKGNHILPQLNYMFDTIYQVMLNCWQLDWDERPTFNELAEHVDFLRNEDCLRFYMYPGFQYEGYYPEMEFSDSSTF